LSCLLDFSELVDKLLLLLRRRGRLSLAAVALLGAATAGS
jgi:hypothetical protein